MAKIQPTARSRGRQRHHPGRPFIGIMFKCCRVYWRIYQTAAGDAYAGHCPRCAAPIRVAIGKGGSRRRFFSAQ